MANIIDNPKANDILYRLKTRNIYKFIGEYKIKQYQLDKYYKYKQIFYDNNIAKQNIIIHIMKIGLSGDNINPIRNIQFYNNDKCVNVDWNNISSLIHIDNTNEFYIRFFIRDTSLETISLQLIDKFVNSIIA